MQRAEAMKKGLPAFVLFLLSPTGGEPLSESSPLAESFRSFPFLLLAIAYDIVEEGLMAKSFFDPAWMDLGLLATYGRAFGVNWVWTVNFTIYHMTVSMFVPVVLTEAVFPNRAKENWIGIWGLAL